VPADALLCLERFSASRPESDVQNSGTKGFRLHDSQSLRERMRVVDKVARTGRTLSTAPRPRPPASRDPAAIASRCNECTAEAVDQRTHQVAPESSGSPDIACPYATKQGVSPASSTA